MAEVFWLWHVRPEEGQEHLDPEMHYIETENKLCGVYSTMKLAESARGALVLQPGFRDWPDCFLVDCHTVDVMEWTEGFVTAGPEDEEESSRERSSADDWNRPPGF